MAQLFDYTFCTIKFKIMSNSNKIILSLIGAAAVGVVAGILLAPEKGGDVRKKIADTATDIASRIGDWISTGKETAESAAGNIANKTRTIGENVANRVETSSN